MPKVDEKRKSTAVVSTTPRLARRGNIWFWICPGCLSINFVDAVVCNSCSRFLSERDWEYVADRLKQEKKIHA